MRITELPAVGGELAGGLFAGLTTKPEGGHYAVVLLPNKPAKALSWKQAMAWAKKLGDGAALPTRPVAALLFSNVREHFEREWHWTADELEASYAWFQSFYSGLQYSTGKSYAGRARAVRLIQLDG